jgi:hypothetical protein
MDAIKKKMQSLKSETENALARATQLDQEAKDSTQRAEKTEEHVRIFFQIKSFCDDGQFVTFDYMFKCLAFSYIF